MIDFVVSYSSAIVVGLLLNLSVQLVLLAVRHVRRRACRRRRPLTLVELDEQLAGRLGSGQRPGQVGLRK